MSKHEPHRQLHDSRIARAAHGAEAIQVVNGAVGLGSTVPLFRSCTWPTMLWLVAEGGGAKYDRPNDVPMEGGAGNRLQPSPGPIGPGPGP